MRKAEFLAAAKNGQAACMRALLDETPPCTVAGLVKARDDRGLTPLMLAASRGRLECVEVLLHAQSDPRAQLVAVEWEGATALHCAAMNGHVDCVRLLLQHDPVLQLSAKDDDGRSPLQHAACNGHAACLPVLLQHDPIAQLEAADGNGNTAAMLAANWGEFPCLRALLEHSPHLQRLDEVLVEAARGWTTELERGPSIRGSSVSVTSTSTSTSASTSGSCMDGTEPDSDAPPPRSYRRCIALLLSMGAMPTAGAGYRCFARVRPVIRDLAARALVPAAASEAAAAILGRNEQRGPCRRGGASV